MTPTSDRAAGRALVLEPASQRLRIVVREALERVQLQVAWAGRAQPFERALESRPPALVVVDAEAEGAEAAIRAAAGVGSPVLAIVPGADPGAADRVLEWGACEVVRAPFPWRELANRASLLTRSAGGAERSAPARNDELAVITRLAGFSPWSFEPGEQTIRTTEQALSHFGVTRPGPAPLELLLAWADPEDRKALVAALTGGPLRDGSFALDTRLTLPDRTERIVHWQGEVPHGSDQCPRGIVRDVTEERRNASRLRFLGHHDELTGTLSRMAFLQQMERAISLARRHRRCGALMLVYLDGFAALNEEHGDEVGDLVLRDAAERLAQCLRQTDYVSRASATKETGQADPLISRLGGDEFTLLLTDLSQPEDAARVAHRIIEAMRVPLSVGGGSLLIGANIGIAIYPRDAVESDSLLRCADAALSRARQTGRNQHQFFQTTSDPARARRLTLERKIARGFENGDFQLYYQPQVDIETGEILAFEALLRWNDEAWGAVSPAEFVPVAEAAGMIETIGEWNMREATRQMCLWRDAGLQPVRMSLNISPRHFRGDRLLRALNQVLWDTELDPELLEFEITENAFMENQEAAVAIASELKRIGVSVALDDFGTGYSSLSHLRRFPIDCLKIDRSFVADISLDPESAAITAAILSMARALRLRVIAEGVETEKQRQFLKARGCREFQGFLFSPAVAPDDAAKWLRRA